MRHPHGAIILTDPDAPLIERDTITCAHCQQIVIVKPGTGATVYVFTDIAAGRPLEVPGAMCGRCWKPVCLRCHQDGRCRPFERRLEHWERQR